MRDRELLALRERLLRAGVAPHFVARAIDEIRDHRDDLAEESRRLQVPVAEVRTYVRESLGSIRSIAGQYCAAPLLMCWTRRHPVAARLAAQAAGIAQLPAALAAAGAHQVPVLARWLACSFLGGLVTAGLLLFMQLTITLS